MVALSLKLLLSLVAFIVFVLVPGFNFKGSFRNTPIRAILAVSFGLAAAYLTISPIVDKYVQSRDEKIVRLNEERLIKQKKAEQERVEEAERQADLDEKERVEEAKRQADLDEKERVEEAERQADLDEKERVEEAERQADLDEKERVEEAERQADLDERKRIERVQSQAEFTAKAQVTERDLQEQYGRFIEVLEALNSMDIARLFELAEIGSPEADQILRLFTNSSKVRFAIKGVSTTDAKISTDGRNTVKAIFSLIDSTNINGVSPEIDLNFVINVFHDVFHDEAGWSKPRIGE